MGCLQSKSRKVGKLGTEHDESRGNSASSKSSKSTNLSTDSGFDDNHANNKLDHSSTKLNNYDLTIVGESLLQKRKNMEISHLNENNSNTMSLNPVSKTGGLSFQVFIDKPGNISLAQPPARLRRLKDNRLKKQVTEEGIKEKLDRAEERRREIEQQKLKEIGMRTHMSEIELAMSIFAQRSLITEIHYNNIEQKSNEPNSILDTSCNQHKVEDRQARLNKIRNMVNQRKPSKCTGSKIAPIPENVDGIAF